MGTLFVDKLDPQSGTSLELGSSGDTVSVNTGATTSLLGNVTLGASGKTITVPSGCTITNNGTQTGFGGDNAPYFSAQRSSGQGIGDNVKTKIAFDTEIVDTDSCYDTSTGRFTPTTAGKYLINATVGLTGDTTDGFISAFLILEKNGTQIAAAYQSDTTQTGRERPFSVTAIVDMNGSSDYVEVYGQCDRTGSGNASATGSNRSTFQGFKLVE